MARNNRRNQAAQEAVRRKKLIRFLVFPVLVLLLILFIVIADRVKHRKAGTHGTAAAQSETLAPGERKPGEDGTGASGETAAAEPETEPYDYANAELVRNTEPGIDRLVSSYLDAQCKGDADSMLRLFGRSDAEGTEELRAQIAAGKKLYDTFENTLSYVIPGVNEGEYIVYVTAQAWFRKVDTPAPMLLRAYAVPQDGQYYFRMDEDLTAEQAEAVRLADGSEAVQKLNNENRTALAKAIVSDAKLGSVYEKLREGAAEAAAEAESSAAESAAESSAAEETVEEAVVEVNVSVDPSAAESGAADTESAVESAAGVESAAEAESAAGAESAVESAAGAENAADTGSTAESGAEAEVSVEGGADTAADHAVQ